MGFFVVGGLIFLFKKPELEYLYDAMGNRIVKITKPRELISDGSGFTEVSPPTEWSYTYYSRDASGNILATFSHSADVETPSQTEYSIYGSSRLGTQTYTAEELNEYEYSNTIQTIIEPITFRQNSIISINGVPFVGGNFSYNFEVGDEIVLSSGETFIIHSNLLSEYNHHNVLLITCDIIKTIGSENISSNITKGRKAYELSNHLGNVMVTVSDKRLGVDDGTGKVDYYLADVTSAHDYYPFGTVMLGRSFSPKDYRFGFNGKEKDDEGMGGGGATYDYGFRIYNPQIAKFLSVDPLSPSYPWYTPYQFAGNKPIWAVDLDGLEELIYTGDFLTKVGNATLKVIHSSDILIGKMDKISDPSKCHIKIYHFILDEKYVGGGGAQGQNVDLVEYAKLMVAVDKYLGNLEKMNTENETNYKSQLTAKQLQDYEKGSVLLEQAGLSPQEILDGEKNGKKHFGIIISEQSATGIETNEEVLIKSTNNYIHEVEQHMIDNVNGIMKATETQHKEAIDYDNLPAEYKKVVDDGKYPPPSDYPKGSLAGETYNEIKKTVKKLNEKK